MRRIVKELGEAKWYPLPPCPDCEALEKRVAALEEGMNEDDPPDLADSLREADGDLRNGRTVSLDELRDE